MATGRRVLLIGSGIGGLAAAVDLASRGADVTVVERAAGPGGKMLPVELAGAAWDAGPTVFTMRWVFDELLAAAGTSLEAQVTLRPLAVLARHAWIDGSCLDLLADPRAAEDAIARFAGPDEARGYAAFRARSRAIYETLEGPFIRGQRPDPLTLGLRVGPTRLGALLQIGSFTTMWRELGRYFSDPRLRQLFGRYATYCGASPFAAPATLMLVAHVEQEGVWDVEGGMGALCRALAGVATSKGARLRYRADVREILVERGKVAGVRLGDGERIDADAVIMNGDASALGAGLLGRQASRATAVVKPRDRSLSALTWTMAATLRGFPAARHNVFFSGDYRAEFEDIAARSRMPGEPTIYVCAEDRIEGAAAPSGPERLLVLINAPATGDTHTFTPGDISRCASTTFERLRAMGLDLAPDMATIQATSPTDFARRFPGTGGALYGRASHGWQASFRRPGARTRIPGLYLAGGSVHPGPGVPMAAMSGRLAAASVLADWASTGWWSRVAMPGGTSTGSATTANSA